MSKIKSMLNNLLVVAIFGGMIGTMVWANQPACVETDPLNRHIAVCPVCSDPMQPADACEIGLQIQWGSRANLEKLKIRDL